MGVPGAAIAAHRAGIPGIWHGLGRMFPEGIGLELPTRNLGFADGPTSTSVRRPCRTGSCRDPRPNRTASRPLFRTGRTTGLGQPAHGAAADLPDPRDRLRHPMSMWWCTMAAAAPPSARLRWRPAVGPGPGGRPIRQRRRGQRRRRRAAPPSRRPERQRHRRGHTYAVAAPPTRRPPRRGPRDRLGLALGRRRHPGQSMGCGRTPWPARARWSPTRWPTAAWSGWPGVAGLMAGPLACDGSWSTSSSSTHATTAMPTCCGSRWTGSRESSRRADSPIAPDVTRWAHDRADLPAAVPRGRRVEDRRVLGEGGCAYFRTGSG